MSQHSPPPQWPSGVSARNLEHWAQLFRDRRLIFRQYDYGELVA